MGFGDLKTRSGQQALNNYLADKSYIEGFQPSQADVVVFEAVSTPPSELAHALRWYNHISSFGDCKSTFAGAKKPLDAYGTGSTVKSTDAEDDSDDDDSDVDLFGSDTEEEKAEKEAARKQREAENAKKPKKQVIAKSTLVLDIKPWDDETDMAEVERCVRSIAKDGLLWGASQLIPLAYGIKKLQITCVIEDDKIDTDFLEEEITSFSDHVQSMDIAAFNKI